MTTSAPETASNGSLNSSIVAPVIGATFSHSATTTELGA